MLRGRERCGGMNTSTSAETTVRSVLRVSGMHCDGCAKSVAKLLQDLGRVAHVSVDLSHGSAVVEHDPTLPTSLLTNALRAEGFLARLASHSSRRTATSSCGSGRGCCCGPTPPEPR